MSLVCDINKVMLNMYGFFLVPLCASNQEPYTTELKKLKGN